MARHNLCTNPACGTNVTGWTSTSGAPTRATDIVGLPVATGVRWTANGFVQTPTVAAVAATQYTCSFYIANNSGFASGTKTVYLAFERSAGGTDFSNTASVSYPAGQVTRASVTATAPANTTGMYLVIDGIFGATGTGFDISAVLYEIAATADTYFDGDSAGASWDGTADNSASTYTAPTDVAGILAASFGGLTSALTGVVTTPALAATGSWQSLANVYRAAADEYREDRETEPMACPNDGEPLDDRGHCAFDGWQSSGRPFG